MVPEQMCGVALFVDWLDSKDNKLDRNFLSLFLTSVGNEGKTLLLFLDISRKLIRRTMLSNWDERRFAIGDWRWMGSAPMGDNERCVENTDTPEECRFLPPLVGKSSEDRAVEKVKRSAESLSLGSNEGANRWTCWFWWGTSVVWFGAAVLKELVMLNEIWMSGESVFWQWEVSLKIFGLNFATIFAGNANDENNEAIGFADKEKINLLNY